jgi:hypothetical protein
MDSPRATHEPTHTTVHHSNPPSSRPHIHLTGRDGWTADATGADADCPMAASAQVHHLMCVSLPSSHPPHVCSSLTQPVWVWPV